MLRLSDLPDLLGRLETAIGENRSIDAEIDEQAWQRPKYALPRDPDDPDLPWYTGRIEDAMILLPGGFDWIIRSRRDGRDVTVILNDGHSFWTGRAGNAALAMSAACLRARATLELRDLLSGRDLEIAVSQFICHDPVKIASEAFSQFLTG